MKIIPIVNAPILPSATAYKVERALRARCQRVRNADLTP